MSFPGLNTPLLYIGDEAWTLADAVEGTQIFGGVGSGKTTGSGALLAESFLRHSFGGLVLCAKPTERARWEAYARTCGREDDLVIFSPNHPWRFNFLDYEYHRAGLGAGQVETIVELFHSLKSMVEGDHTMNSQDGHWERAASELIRNAIHVLALSQGRLSLDELYQLVMDAPEGDQAQDVAWQRHSFCWQALKTAQQKASTPRDQHNLLMAKRYWLQTYAGLADKTRSSVYSTFSAIADVMLHDAMWELFCTETNLVPEDTYSKGSIIVLDMPIREYGKVGILAQRLMKHLFQRAWLRRSVAEYPRPVFLFVDEAQNFVDSFDFLFQAEAREVLCANIFITQTINNYYAVLGHKSRDEAHALLGTFQKLFHAGGDPVTNSYAAESIGYTHKYRHSWNAGNNEIGSYFSIGASEQRVYKIEPSLFTTLLKGGEINGWHTEAIWLQSGRQWQANGENWLKIRITQAGAPPAALAPALPAHNRAAWVIMLLEWLLIFLHRKNAMDVLEAMQWQENLLTVPRQETIGAAIPVTGARPNPPPEALMAAPHRLALPPSAAEQFPSPQEARVADGSN